MYHSTTTQYTRLVLASKDIDPDLEHEMETEPLSDKHRQQMQTTLKRAKRLLTTHPDYNEGKDPRNIFLGSRKFEYAINEKMIKNKKLNLNLKLIIYIY